MEVPDPAPATGLFPSLPRDDYPASEVDTRKTRRKLEGLLESESRQVRLTTRSPRLLRDLDLLRQLDGHHVVTVRLGLASMDVPVARRLEGSGPTPAQRLRALAELAAAGLGVTLLWTPVLPGLNDDPGSVDRLFVAARRAGARDVEMELPELSLRDRWRLFQRDDQAETFSVRELFDWRGRLVLDAARRLERLFNRQRLAHGFPRALPGRG